jgi:uncharacterized repeat protein (TIGR01451 family)
MDDGTMLYGEQVVHQFIAHDNYTVQLSVVDDDGAMDSQSIIIQVIGQVDSSPVISHVGAYPDPQYVGTMVNISCVVTDDVGVGSVFVNITYPDDSIHNISMNQNAGEYFLKQTYQQIGSYEFFIWANDTIGNTNTSDVSLFEIISLPPCDIGIEKYVKCACSPAYSKNITAVVGDVVTFKLMVNVSSSLFNSVTIVDTVPDGLMYIVDSTVITGVSVVNEEPVIVDDTLTWLFENINDVAIVIEFQATVMDCGTLENMVNATGHSCTTIYDEDSATVYVPCDAAIHVDKEVSLDGVEWSDGPISVMIGEIIYFRINVSNIGDYNLTGVTVSDILPVFMTYNNDAMPNLSIPYENNMLEWFFPDVFIGESKNMIYSAEVIRVGGGDNIVTAVACGGNPMDEDSVRINVEGGMNIRKMVSLDGETWVKNVTALAGTTIRFNLTLSYYNENHTIFHIHIKDVLPAGLSYANDATPKEPVIVGNILYWNFTGPNDYLVNGSMLSIEFNAMVEEAGTYVNLINVTAEESSGETLYDKDTAIVFTPLGPLMQCEKWVKALDGSWVDEVDAEVGDTVLFNVSMQNIGFNPIYGIDVLDIFPLNITYVANSARIYFKEFVYTVEPSIDAPNNTLLWSNLNFYTGEYLEHGERIFIRFSADVIGEGYLENYVNITACMCNQCIPAVCEDTAYVNVTTTSGNHPPSAMDPDPADNATGVIAGDVPLQVKVVDMDGDSLTVTFYNASDDGVIDTDINVVNNTLASVVWENVAENKTYSWYVKISDGLTTRTSLTWSFTTEEEGTNHKPNVPSNPSPSNNAGGIILSPMLSVQVSDPDGDGLIVTFYDASDDSVIGTDSCTSSCTADTVWNDLSYSTQYRWYVVVSDGRLEETSPVWSFTIRDIDVELDVNILGGIGVSAEIINAGSDPVEDVSWRMEVTSMGMLNRVNRSAEGIIDRIVGGDDALARQLRVFGFGFIQVQITVESDMVSSPVVKTKDAILILTYVIIR